MNPEEPKAPGTPEDKPAEQVPSAQPDKPDAPTAKNKKGLPKPLLIGLVIALVLAAGYGVYAMYFKEDTPSQQPAQAQDSQNTQDDEELASQIPAGYKKFEIAEASISFVYPESWGEATVKPGEEERMEHLTAGSQKVITFSLNDTIVGGLMSNDWTHDPDMGHGGVGEPGAKTMADAKDAKNHTNAANIHVDTAEQFAYVGYCADNCTSDAPRTQLVYSIAIDANTDYDVIQFSQAGDPLPATYIDDGIVDYEKLDAADLSALFPKTDPRFVELQKLADSINSF